MASPNTFTLKIVTAMTLFFAIGTPIVLYDWWTLDQVLVGRFPICPMIISAILALIFVASAVSLGRYLRTVIPVDE
ncbi:MAG: hypothetical protein ABSC63_20945 [Candidatus Binataceae bacterium]